MHTLPLSSISRYLFIVHKQKILLNHYTVKVCLLFSKQRIAGHSKQNRHKNTFTCQWKYSCMGRPIIHKHIPYIAPNFHSTIFWQISYFDIQSQKVSLQKFEQSTVGTIYRFTAHDHKIFIMKSDIQVIFNAFTKFLDQENLKLYGTQRTVSPKLQLIGNTGSGWSGFLDQNMRLTLGTINRLGTYKDGLFCT